MSSFSGYALVLSSILLVVIAEAPLPIYRRQVPTPVLTSQFLKRDDSGQHSFLFVQDNGAYHSEQARLKQNTDNSDFVLVKEGKYGYTSPEGIPVEVAYVADENGFNIVGDSLPLAPSSVRRHKH